MAVGQTIFSPAGSPRVAATDMVSKSFGPIRSESQRRQYSRNSAHPCLNCWSLGRCPSCWAQYTSATTPG